MDLRKLKKLIELVEESGITELEITEGEEKVRISKSGASTTPAYAWMPPVMQHVAAPLAQENSQSVANAAAGNTSEATDAEKSAQLEGGIRSNRLWSALFIVHRRREQVHLRKLVKL